MLETTRRNVQTTRIATLNAVFDEQLGFCKHDGLLYPVWVPLMVNPT